MLVDPKQGQLLVQQTHVARDAAAVAQVQEAKGAQSAEKMLREVGKNSNHKSTPKFVGKEFLQVRESLFERG